jgi:hypothetical protein
MASPSHSIGLGRRSHVCKRCGAPITDMKRCTKKYCSTKCQKDASWERTGRAYQAARIAERSAVGKTFSASCNRCGDLFAYEFKIKRRTVCDPCRATDWAWKKFGLDHRGVAEVRATNCCAICGETEKPGGKFGVHYHIDHDHETGRVRGLLCAPCNVALGMMENDPARLRAAADYIESHEGELRCLMT